MVGNTGFGEVQWVHGYVGWARGGYQAGPLNNLNKKWVVPNFYNFIVGLSNKPTVY